MRARLVLALVLALSVPSPAQERSGHWAFRAPVRGEPPVVDGAGAGWCRNEIDRFTLAAMRAQGLAPSPEAERAALLRRASFALTGLPPSLEELDAFLADQRPDGYEAAVDRLLASPRYGEHLAAQWLDLARYADTNGYEKDRPRSMWPWRDWVIRACNDDLPFDSFTTLQLAGDLLPGATTEQVIATGYHRNSMLNDEGGIDPEEFRVVAVKDRVAATATTWLGLTMDCAQCHDHKHDPITQRDYYRFYAFFDQTEDVGVGNAPILELPTPEERAGREAFLARRAPAAAAFGAQTPELVAARRRFFAAPPREVPAGIAQIAALDESARTAEQVLQLDRWWRGLAPELAAARDELAAIDKALAAIQPATTMVLREIAKPRSTRLLKRGDFRQPGEAVEPAVPPFLHAWPEGAPRNRLGLARWLVDARNPLTARVVVNRLWAALFGRGLVTTLDDFGTHGEPPSHLELLDWLATELVAQGWSLKRLQRLLVTSATFRQSSHVSNAARAADPDNVWLARGPRFRLSFEAIRDLGLGAAGLLEDPKAGRIGGPSVMPPQPPGIWENSFGFHDLPDRWVEAQDADRFRRGLYVYLRRTALYPTYVLFDGVPRDVCWAQRQRTNTPLQALATLNDPAFVEVASRLAQRLLGQSGRAEAAVIDELFRRCLARGASAEESAELVRLVAVARERFTMHPTEAAALLQHCRVAAPGAVTEIAAWTVVANVVLNLDETLTTH